MTNHRRMGVADHDAAGVLVGTIHKPATGKVRSRETDRSYYRTKCGYPCYYGLAVPLDTPDVVLCDECYPDGLPALPPPSKVQTLSYVTIEAGPIDGYATAVNEHGTVIYEPEWAALPAPFLTALRILVEDQFDNATCQAPYCPSKDQPRPAVVGYHISGDQDQYQSWSFTTLVQTGDKVITVCEDCTPETVYAA